MLFLILRWEGRRYRVIEVPALLYHTTSTEYHSHSGRTSFCMMVCDCKAGGYRSYPAQVQKNVLCRI